MRITTEKQSKKRGLAWIIKPVIAVFAIFYLSFHTMHGERGIFALLREQTRHEQLEEQLQQTKAERQMVERRVRHMRDGSLDLDLLDEQMRRMMGVSGEGELVLLVPEN